MLRLGCLVWALVALLVAITIGLVQCAPAFLSPSTQRSPEIPIQELLERQREALPPGWAPGPIHVETDTDFTSAGWVASAGFSHPDEKAWSREAITQEIHVFSTAAAARWVGLPSPASVNLLNPGSLPAGWSYAPPHADRFELKCGDPPPEGTMWCRTLLRYQEYVIFTQFPIYARLSTSDLQRFLEATDAEMARYLANSVVQEGPRVIP